MTFEQQIEEVERYQNEKAEIFYACNGLDYRKLWNELKKRVEAIVGEETGVWGKAGYGKDGNYIFLHDDYATAMDQVLKWIEELEKS